MWLYEETTEVDLRINKALNRAKKSIMDESRDDLFDKGRINAAGQIAIRADIVAENAFLQSLVHDGMSGILYSEESGVKKFGDNFEGDDAIILLLDPLDGSNNYLKKLPIGCISVAYGNYTDAPNLMDLDRAAILNLYSDEIFFGVKDIGSWFNGNEIKFNNGQLNEHELSQMSFYAYGEVAKRYFFDFQEKYSLRSLGSAAWELAMTTIGINDAFVDLRGVLRAHDFIAAKIIIESVGGTFKFLDSSIQDISKISLDSFKTGYAVVASHHPSFVDQLLDDFRSHGLIV